MTAKIEATKHLIDRTRKHADQMTAHLDEGGEFSAVNILELIADVLDLGNRLEKAEAECDRLHDVLSELVDIVEGMMEGDYVADSFTLQPARQALKDTQT